MRRRSLPLGRRVLAVAASLALLLAAAPTAVTQDDPRVGLTPGLDNAGEAGGNLELLAHLSKPDGFFNPFNAGDLSYANSDLAFSGDYAFVGSFHGFQVYDVSDPEAPELVTAYVCPGGQGDLSVYGDLLFMSVEETRAKTDCTVTPAATPLTRFRGVRIYGQEHVGGGGAVAGQLQVQGVALHGGEPVAVRHQVVGGGDARTPDDQERAESSHGPRVSLH